MFFRALAFLAVVILAPVTRAAECPAAATEKATIAEALSGGLLRFADGSTFRLSGIQVPVPALDFPADKSWRPGETVRQHLGSIVAGIRVAITSGGEAPDRYGRRRGYVFLSDGRLLQRVMVERGWALARWLPEESQCFQALLSAEREARKTRSGLWAGVGYGVKSANDPYLLGRNGLYELVEGRVVSVGRGTRMLFLDFGRNYRQDFTVMMPPAVADRLAAAGLSAEDFANRRVRVRGLIEESGGPAIRLNDPAEIEILDDDQDDVGAER